MPKETEQRLKTECKYVLAALASLCAGIVSLGTFGLWWGLNYGLAHMDGINKGGMTDDIVFYSKTSGPRLQ
jgi:hypothetical protein